MKDISNLNALFNPAHHAHPHVMLLRGGHDPLVKVFNLLVQPGKRERDSFIKSLF